MTPDRAFSDLIGRVYDCALDPALWPDVLGQITRLFRCELGDLSVVHPLNGTIQVMALHNWPDELVRRVQANMSINPTTALALTAPVDEPMCSSMHLDITAFHNSRYWRNCFDGFDYYDYMVSIISKTATSAGSWGVCGSQERGPFSDEDVYLARMLSPHIRRSVAISGVLGHQRVIADTLQSALDALASAAFIVEPDGRLIYSNRQGRQELLRARLFRESGERLQGVTTDASRLIADLSQRRTAHQRGRDARLEDTSGGLIYVNWVALQIDKSPSGPTLILLRQPDPELVTPITAAMNAFALTSGEVQVLAQVLQGRTLAEAAQVLGVARSTIKTHLDAIYRKTNTNRRAELAGLVVSLASPLRV